MTTQTSATRLTDTVDNGNVFNDPKSDILNKPGIVDPQSGRILTVGEAIQLRILDVRTGEIIIDQERISLQEAIERKLIDATLANSLLEPNAIFYAGKPISLLEVIQKELLDAENGYETTEKRIKVIHTTTTTKTTTSTTDTGQFASDGDDGGDTDTIGLATVQNSSSDSIRIKAKEMCLYDAIVHGLIDNNGWLLDRNSGDRFRLDSAISNALITSHVREIVDAKNDVKITLQEALTAGIINAKTGRYMQNVTKEKLSFIEAKNRQLIGKPMTLKDVCDLNLMEKNGTIISPMRRAKLNILDAIGVGVLDSDTIKSISKTKDERLTLAEALGDGVILPHSRYCDVITQEEISIPEAVDRGLISSVSQRSIFNIDGFKDPYSNDFISLNAALAKDIIRKKSGQFQLDIGKGNTLTLLNGLENGLVRSEFYEMITRPIGVFDKSNNELNVLDLVYNDSIDPKSGFLLDPNTKAIVPLDQAIATKLITPDGALLLSSLLNITLTTETVTKTIHRYVTMSGDDSSDKLSANIPTFTEAVRLGYIDETHQLYTDPNSGETYSIQQALNHGLVRPDSNTIDIPTPVKSTSTVVIQEKIVEPQHLNETIEKISVIHQVQTAETSEIESPKDHAKTVTSNFIETEKTTKFFDCPKEGWMLSTAIENQLFDPATGLFHIIATDRLVSFEECIQLEIIIPKSVSVIDPTNGRKIPIRRSFEKRILDATGNYKKSNEKIIGMIEAINSQLIILEDPSKNAHPHDFSKQFSYEPVRSTTPQTKSRTHSQEVPSPEPVQLVPGIIYDPSTALVIFTETGQSENIVSAVVKGLVDSNMVKIIDPQTGTPLNVQEAVDNNVIDSKTGEILDGSKRIDLINAAKLGLVAVIGSPLVAAADAIDSMRFIFDPKTGQHIPYELAYERGLISKDELLESPKHKNAACKLVVYSPHHTPQRISKPIVLQKMRKKIVNPKDALLDGIIDAKTAESLETKDAFINDSGDSQSLSDAVKAKKIIGTSGKIIDPQRGDILTISEAMDRGILDSDGTNRILVPLHKSLTIAELKKQGLIDPKTKQIIHPETGGTLALREAIVCEIVDGLSGFIDPHTNNVITLKQAIDDGIIDDEKSLIQTDGGKVNLLEAIEQNYFPSASLRSPQKTANGRIVTIPLGMTMAVAIKRGLIDSTTNEFLNPITNERMPLVEAIENNTIMALPYTPNVDSINVVDALNANLIDISSGTVKNPSTSEILSITEAIENGLLVVKPLPELIAQHSSGPMTSITETVTSYHTITTKTVEVLSGYVLISPDEVKNTQTGEILSIEDAKKQGIVKDETDASVQYAIDESKITFSEAICRGLLDIKAGTFTDPISGITITIQQAISDGLLETNGDDTDSATETPKSELLTLSEAVETIYDDNAKKFRDPKVPDRLISFSDAVKEGIVDGKSIVFDVKAGKAHTLEEAIAAGVLDAQSGETKQANGDKMNVKKAVKLGLMTVVGAPILAGLAVTDAIKRATKKSEKPTPLARTKAPSEANQIIGKSITSAAILPQPKENRSQILANKIETVKSDIVIETVRLIQSEALRFPEAIEAPTISTIVEERSQPIIRINETLTPEQLESYGVFDKTTETFIHPDTGERIPFYSLIYDLNLFDPSNIYVKDLSRNVYEAFDVALERPLIDKNTGHMVDSKTGKRVPFLECARRKWILERIPEENEDIDEDAIDHIDSQSVESVEEEIEPQSIVAGIRTGTIRIEKLLIKNPATEEIIPMRIAIDQGIVDLRNGIIVDPNTKEAIDFAKACDDGILFASRQPQISLEAIVRQKLYDPNDGRVFDLAKRNSFNLKEAIANGIIHPDISLINDTTTNEHVPLSTALDKQLVLYTGKINVDNNEMPFDVALEKGFILTKAINWDLLDVLIKQYYQSRSGTFLNPKSGEYETLEEALNCGWINISTVLVKNDQSDKVMTLVEAIDCGLVDAKRGILTRPELPLDDAQSKGYLISTTKPYSLADLIIRNLYDAATGRLNIDGIHVTLAEALDNNLIHTNDLVVRDSKAGEIISLSEAIQREIIDPSTGHAIDSRLNIRLTLKDAYERGILLQSKRRRSLPDAVFKGIYDPKSGKFSTAHATEKLSTERAIRRGLIDAHSTIVNVKGRVLPFELAAESGIVDIRRGLVVDDYDNKIDFSEAFDRGILIEVKKPISLCEALLKGLCNEETGLFMDPKSGRRLTITQSLGKNLIDPNSVEIKDVATGVYRPISLVEATKSGLIDGHNAQILVGDNRISLRQAFDIGLLADKNAPISIQRAIHMGLYDEKTGKIYSHKWERRFTLYEAIQKFIINSTLPFYFNEHDERLLTLGEACLAHVVDRHEGFFKVPFTDVFIPLNEAMRMGLIIDIESGSFGLYEIIAMGLYDRTSKKIIHPVTRHRLTLQQACSERFISAAISLVKDITSVQYIQLNEAIKAKIINDVKGTYVLSKYSIDLYEGRKRGLIVSSQRLLAMDKAIKMQICCAETGKFVDPMQNAPFNLQESIDNGLIDADKTMYKSIGTGQYKTLPQAIADGNIDVSKGLVYDATTKLPYTYDVAFENYLLVPSGMPSTGIRWTNLDLTMAALPKQSGEMSLQDAIQAGIIEPETAVFKDPKTGKFKALKHVIKNIGTEMRGVVDRKALFFVFDKSFVVYTTEPISFDYAVESKQLDLSTGKFVEASNASNKTAELSLKDAVGVGRIDPESVVIKDGVKRRLVRLPEAFRKGLIDGDKANVFDSETSKLHSLRTANDIGLLITSKRSLSLFDALKYELYDPVDGKFSDPFATSLVYSTLEPIQEIKSDRITLNDAIASGLIDPTTTVVRDMSNSTILPLTAAITLNVIDPINGQLIKSNNERIDLVRAQEKGFLLPAEQRVSCYCDIDIRRYAAFSLSFSSPVFFSLFYTFFSAHLTNAYKIYLQ